jgi:hypothetical protein
VTLALLGRFHPLPTDCIRYRLFPLCAADYVVRWGWWEWSVPLETR